jgi:hypothetical protein
VLKDLYKTLQRNSELMMQRASITQRVGSLLQTLSNMNIEEDPSSSSEDLGQDAFSIVHQPS